MLLIFKDLMIVSKAFQDFWHQYQNYYIKIKLQKKKYENHHYVKGIKSRFTQVWGIFLDYQINYIVQRSSLLNNDVIMFHIFGSLVYNQNLFMKKNGKSNHYRDEWWNDIIHMGDKKGISAMTISDLTGIPRPTVIRKLKVLMKEKKSLKSICDCFLISQNSVHLYLNHSCIDN